MLKSSLLLVASLLVVSHGSFVRTAEIPSDVVAPPLEADMVIPEPQKVLHTNGFPIIEVLRNMILEAVEQRNNMGATFGLMMKYTGQLQGAITTWERDLKSIPTEKCKKPSSDYYFNCATLIEEKILKKSDQQMATVNRNAAKAKLNINDLITKVNKYFDNLKTAVTISPSGAYLDWENVTFNGVKATDEWTEIYNMLRVLGYDNMTKLLATNLVGNLRTHAEERKREENPNAPPQWKLPFGK